MSGYFDLWLEDLRFEDLFHPDDRANEAATAALNVGALAASSTRARFMNGLPLPPREAT